MISDAHIIDIERDWVNSVIFINNSPVTPTYWRILSDVPIIKERQEYLISQCEKFKADPKLCLAIVPCEGDFYDEKICNKQYGCSGGQGSWQFIQSTWNRVILEMSKLGLLEPECTNTDSVFIMKCNLKVGAYLLATEGTRHWGDSTTEWGSWSCWYPKYK